MKQKSLPEVFMEYLKGKRRRIGVFIIFIMIFYAIFYLYQIPIETIGYASLLCLILGSFFMIAEFMRYWKKYQILAWIRKDVAMVSEQLPLAEDFMESCYQDILKKLEEEKTQIVSKADSEKTDLLDYYTLWVHQIKTPIAAMYLLLETEEFSGKMDLNIELFKVEQYVEMVLQSLRLFSDTSDFVIKQCRLEEIVRQAVRRHTKIFIGKKLSLDFREFSCEILTDEKWSLFVVEQILSNALKYTKSGTISIYLDEQEEKTLVIEDTGIGIYPEDLPRVCEKGFTGYNGRDDKKSTGIGLYLCKQVLDKMSHTITIESAVGKGTKVKIGFVNGKVEVRYE